MDVAVIIFMLNQESISEFLHQGIWILVSKIYSVYPRFANSKHIKERSGLPWGHSG